MKNEIEILKEVVGNLEALKIPYMLTGSMAMIYYSKPRLTRDIDIVIELNKETSNDFIQKFQDEYYISKEAVDDSIKNEFLFNIINNENAVKIDFIIKKNSEYRRNEFERKKKVRFLDFEIFIVNKEDLIISKLFWAKDSGSEMQKKDVKNLIEGDFDKTYIDNWTSKLGLFEFWKETINE